MTLSISEINNDVLRLILSQLPAKDWGNVAKVSRFFRSLMGKWLTPKQYRCYPFMARILGPMAFEYFVRIPFIPVSPMGVCSLWPSQARFVCGRSRSMSYMAFFIESLFNTILFVLDDPVDLPQDKKDYLRRLIRNEPCGDWVERETEEKIASLAPPCFPRDFDTEFRFWSTSIHVDELNGVSSIPRECRHLIITGFGRLKDLFPPSYDFRCLEETCSVRELKTAYLPNSPWSSNRDVGKLLVANPQLCVVNASLSLDSYRYFNEQLMFNSKRPDLDLRELFPLNSRLPKKLEVLDLWNRLVEIDGYDSIGFSRLKHLKFLAITAITSSLGFWMNVEEEYHPVNNPTQSPLMTLKLKSFTMTENCLFPFLAHFPKLKHLTLDCPQLEPAALMCLKNIPFFILKTLHLSPRTKVDAETLTYLQNREIAIFSFSEFSS